MVMMKIIIIITDWMIYKKFEGDKKFKEKIAEEEVKKNILRKKFNRWKTTRWNKGRQNIEENMNNQLIN